MRTADAADPVPPPFLRRTLVLIPALNEEASVAPTVRYWLNLGAPTVRVVDNGSTDNTARLAGEAGAEALPEPRRGYGAACWTGLQNVPPALEWILFSAADGSDRLVPEDLVAWQKEVEAGTDLLLGDRVSAPEARRHLKSVQRCGNRLCCWLIWLGWGRRFHDMGSLRLIRVAAFQRLGLQDRGFGWNIEMQVRALELGVRCEEIPVFYYPRLAGASKISGSLRGTVKAAWGMMKVLAGLWRTRKARAHRATGNAV